MGQSVGARRASAPLVPRFCCCRSVLRMRLAVRKARFSKEKRGTQPAVFLTLVALMQNVGSAAAGQHLVCAAHSG